MIQFIFLGLLLITFVAGAFTYFFPPQKPLNPMKYMMDNSGYTSQQTLSNRKFEQISMKTSKGVMKMRRKMDDLAIEQNRFLDSLQDQQQVLKNFSKETSDLMLEAQQKGEAGSKDMLRLETLTSQMQEQQRVLMDRSQQLISLNDQLTKNRQSIAEQIDLTKINTETTLDSLQQQYASLNNQATSFFDKVTQHNQEVRELMDNMQGKLNDMANDAAYHNTVQQQVAKDHIQRMLDLEHEDMIKLADAEERSRNFLQDMKEQEADAKELLDDKLKQTQDMMDDQRQRQEDQQTMIRQHIADQEQQIQDSQAQRNQ